MIKNKGTKSPSSMAGIESPVYPPMTSNMKVDFLYNEEGDAWLLHDKPLPDILKWIEYDVDMNNVILVTRSGKIQDMGLELPENSSYHLQNVATITVLLMEDGKIADFAIVPLITRDMTVN